MGIETAIILSVASTALQTFSTLSSAKKEAKATVAQGNIELANKAIDIRRKAASAQTSFLNSGLTLEGTPMAAISNIFGAGQQDIAQMSGLYNTKSKNIISSARSKAISDIAGKVSGFAAGGGFEGFGSGFSSGFENAATIGTGAQVGSIGNIGITGTGLPWQSGFTATPLPWA